jgi:ABC-type glycerol-3-phosphate transport system permease component
MKRMKRMNAAPHPPPQNFIGTSAAASRLKIPCYPHRQARTETRPVFSIIMNLILYDTKTGITRVSLSGGIAMSLFGMRAAFASISDDYTKTAAALTIIIMPGILISRIFLEQVRVSVTSGSVKG